jgi:hypothetical protein
MRPADEDRAEPSSQRRARAQRRSWLVHWSVLGALLVAFVVWRALDAQAPPSAIDLRALVTVVFAAMGLAYALVTTIAMIWLSRVPRGAILLHGVLLPLVALSLYLQDEAERREHDEVRERAGPSFD